MNERNIVGDEGERSGRGSKAHRPFTCSAPHFKSNIPLFGFLYVVGFVVFTYEVPPEFNSEGVSKKRAGHPCKVCLS